MSTTDLSSFFATATDPLDVDALMAFHRSRWGGMRMDGEEAEAERLAAEEAETERLAAEQAEAERVAAEAAREAEENEDELPEWARKKMTTANTQAANYRRQLRESEEKYKDAKTPEEIEAIRTELAEERATAELDLIKEVVALKYRLPEKLAARLVGTTKEALEADAESLAEYADAEDPDLHGGLTPRDKDTSSDDPGDIARRYGRGRRSYKA